MLAHTKKKFQQVFHTRWLSFDGAVQAILTNLEALISALISDSTSDPTAKGILTFITTYQFLASTHLLCDALPTLTPLRHSSDNVLNSLLAVQAATGAIEGFKHAPGPRLDFSVIYRTLQLNIYISRSSGFQTVQCSESTLRRAR